MNGQKGGVALNIAILENQHKERLELEAILLRCFGKLGIKHINIRQYRTGELFLDSFSEIPVGHIDLILLDIVMDSMTGIDVARRIREKDEHVDIVFVTRDNGYATESYEVKASYYLKKPVCYSDIMKMLERVGVNRLKHKRFVQLPDRTRIRLSDIVYTEKHKHYINFFMIDSRVLKQRLTQGELKELLAHHEFNEVGQGTVVNFEHIEEMTCGGFLMDNGDHIQIPRRRMHEVKDIYLRYMFERSMTEDHV